MADRDEFLRGIVDILEHGVQMVDADRRLLYWNRKAERITGFASREVLGTRCCEEFALHVDDSGRALPAGRCPLAKALVGGRTRVVEAFLRDSHGRLLRTSLRTAAIRDGEGRIIGALQVFGKLAPQWTVDRRLSALEKLAYFDPLTELPNRRLLEMRLKEFLSEMTRYGRTFGVVMLDVDAFKGVNDTFGHSVGDRILEIVGKALRASLRPFDVVGRWGGDEFLALVKNVEDEQLQGVVEKFRRRVAECRLVVEGHALRVTVSCGAMLAEPGLTVEAIVGAADSRMYQRKLRRHLDPGAGAVSGRA